MREPLESDTLRFEPHPGPQSDFLASPADICIGGGQRGGGKTRALLLEPLRHYDVPGFSSVVFRRESPQLEGIGGPVEDSKKVYPYLGASYVHLRWSWPSTATVAFRHIQFDKDKEKYKGWQIALPLFDQLEEFNESMFWAILAANRSTCGVAPYLRATCNPVPDDDKTGGWLCRMLAWWINQETGFAIPERSGVVRWFVRVDEKIEWADSREELIGRYPKQHPLSFSFVPMALEDNPTLVNEDPAYVAKLEALPYVERMRFRHGNWKVRAQAGLLFKREDFRIIDTLPNVSAWRCRYWDMAGTEGGGGARTAGVRVAITTDGRVIIEDVVKGRWEPKQADDVFLQVAKLDGPQVPIFEEQEPGSSGKAVVQARARMLHGFMYAPCTKRQDKVTSWRPLRSQVAAHNVYVLSRPWATEFIDECDNTDGVSGLKDQIDAASGAYIQLVKNPPAGVNVARLSGY